MANQLPRNLLREELQAKQVQLAAILKDISTIVIKIHKLSQKYYKEDAKISHKLVKIQFSRPRGNPANYWPHTPMTPRVRAFYQNK